MTRLIPLFIVFVSAVQLLSAQKAPSLTAGPMIGAVNHREARLWFQFDRESEVGCKCTSDDNTLTVKSKLIRTTDEKANTATVLIQPLVPGKKYSCKCKVSDLVDKTSTIDLPTLAFSTPPDWAYRTDPPAFRLATGSCSFTSDSEYDRPGKPYGGDYQIYGSIVDQDPDLMLWLGDNMYLRPADETSRTGIYYRNSKTRSLKEMQPLLRHCPNIAIWDDHDFGPNNADRSYFMKATTLEAFGDFWPNPTLGVPNVDGGITTKFQWGDVEFFLLDNRYHRASNERESGSRGIIGSEQLEWLIDNLKFSRASFKLVAIGGQVLNPVRKYETHQNVAPGERRAMLEMIQAEDIKGVVFLTGDRHHTELSLLEEPGEEKIYDLTVSPLTSSAHDAEDEENTLRIEGTHVGERNFATLDFAGKYGERTMTITIWNSDGKQLWQREISQKEWDSDE